MEMNYNHVLIAGIGISGIGAATLLNKKGVRVTFYDGNENADLEKFYTKLPEGFHPEVILGELSQENLKETDFMVISPGIPTDAPFTDIVRNAGVPIIGEIKCIFQCHIFAECILMEQVVYIYPRTTLGMILDMIVCSEHIIFQRPISFFHTFCRDTT